MAVDPHRPRLQTVGVVQGLGQIAGPDAGGKTKIAVVGQAQRLLAVGHPHQVHHRAKHLLSGEAQSGVRVNHQRRGNIVPPRIRSGTAADELCLLLASLFKVGRHLVTVGPGDHRVDLRRLLHPRPHLQGFYRLLETADQGVKQRRFDIDPRAGGTDLSLIEEATGHQPLNNPLGIGIFEHNRRVLAAQLQRHAGQAVGGHAGYLFPGRRRAGKTDLRHLRMGGQRRAAAGAAAGDHVKHPVRNARLGRQLRHP